MRFLRTSVLVLCLFFSAIQLYAQCPNCTTGADVVGANGTFPVVNCGPTAPGWGNPGLTWLDCSTVVGTVNDNYTMTTNASTWNFTWSGTSHTADGTGILLVDGPTAADGDHMVWNMNVMVQAGHSYLFNAFVENIFNSNVNSPVFYLKIDGAEPTNGVHRTIVLLPGSGWATLCSMYSSNKNGIANISVWMVGVGANRSGNDGAVDDITFAPITSGSSDFTYAQPACNKPFMFTPTDMADLHGWDYGDGSIIDLAPVTVHQYQLPGSYVVTHTVQGPCGISTTSKVIKVESCCTCVTDPDAASPNNMVTDGNFVAPPCASSPYSSDYIKDPCTTPQNPPIGHDHFVESLTSTFAGRTYCSVDDHSFNGGSGFLIVDGAMNGDPVAVLNGGHPRAWFQTGPNNNGNGYIVNQGQSYCFKASFFNPEYQYPAKPSVKLVIKTAIASYTVALIDFLPYNNECGWTTICGCWMPKPNENKVIELDIILESNDCNNANDVGIDDIIFEPTQQGCNPDCNTQNQINQGDKILQGGGDPTGGMAPVRTNIKTINNGGADINVHPIPVMQGHDLHVSYHSMDDRRVNLQVLSNDGKVQLQMDSQIKLGQNEIIVKTESLKPGTYILRMESNEGVDTKTIVVQ